MTDSTVEHELMRTCSWYSSSVCGICPAPEKLTYWHADVGILLENHVGCSTFGIESRRTSQTRQSKYNYIILFLSFSMFSAFYCALSYIRADDRTIFIALSLNPKSDLQKCANLSKSHFDADDVDDVDDSMTVESTKWTC